MQAADFAGDIGRSSVTASGLWRLSSEGVVAIDRAYSGPATVLAPSEDVLIVSVDLPFPTRRQRETAAPFAVEGLIAEPLDQVHVALGMEISDRRHLCGVVRRDVMVRWIATLEKAGLAGSILTPDALMVPMPSEASWRVVVEGTRALVRSGDGTGFAIDTEALAIAWEAAGRPRLLSSGAPLPETMQDGIDETTFDLDGSGSPVLVVPPLDLRQGVFAAVRHRAGSPMRTLAWVLGLGLVAHLAILSVDTLALHLSANRAEAGVRTLLAQRAPGSETATDLTAEVDRIAPVSGGADGAFVATLGRASKALTGSRVAFRTITYSPDGPLQLEITAPDAATLDRAVQSLNGTGMTTQSQPGVANLSGGTDATLSIANSGAAQ